MSIMEACIPAVLLIDKDNMYFADHYGHTKNDNLQKIDYEHGSFMSTIAYRSLMHMANRVEPMLRLNWVSASDWLDGLNGLHVLGGLNGFNGLNWLNWLGWLNGLVV